MVVIWRRIFTRVRGECRCSIGTAGRIVQIDGARDAGKEHLRAEHDGEQADHAAHDSDEPLPRSSRAWAALMMQFATPT